MKTALVCGAGGFIGNHLVTRLKKEGYWVRGVDIKLPEYSLSDADEFVTGDLRDVDVCRNAIRFPGPQGGSIDIIPDQYILPFDEIYQLAADMGGAGYIFTGDNDANVMHNSATINLNILDSIPKFNEDLEGELPEDHQPDLLTCDETIFDDSLNVIAGFFLNPRDPGNGGNHNHKAFSVIAYGDTVWTGTANGINRGILGENGCVDWMHYSFQYHNLSGNFVVGLGLQVWNSHRVIWAATMNANSPGEQRGVSFTTDDGDTWRTTLLGERVYNVSAFDSLVFVCSGSGLWKTIVHHPDDPLVWARYQPMVEHTEFYNQEILTNEVYTAVVDDRSYFPNKTLWVGTPDGLARLKNSDEITWDIFRVETDQNKVFAYPNPFSPSVDNVIDGNGYIRFSAGAQAIDKANISVYNFAMEKVLSRLYDRNIDGGELKWNGKDNSGYLVANGVYFVHLELNNYLTPDGGWRDHWIKVIVVQ